MTLYTLGIVGCSAGESGTISDTHYWYDRRISIRWTWERTETGNELNDDPGMTLCSARGIIHNITNRRVAISNVRLILRDGEDFELQVWDKVFAPPISIPPGDSYGFNIKERLPNDLALAVTSLSAGLRWSLEE